MTGTDASLTDLRFVGPATEAVLDEEGVTRADIVEKRVSHAELVESGVNPGVAARVRREHSLSWSFTTGDDDLKERASQVSGLDDGERDWIAASSGEWDADDASEAAGTDGGSRSDAAAEEAAWRDRSKPEPVTVLSDVDEAAASDLAEAGINSIRRLAVANPEEVARSLDLGEETVQEWREAARDHRA